MSSFHRFSAVYAICAGICIPLLWAYFLLSHTFEAWSAEPTRVAFLMAAEGLTAAVALAAGVGILMRRGWATRAWFVAIGMILYAVTLATGEFAQVNNWLFFGFFLLLCLGTATMAIVSLKLWRPATRR